MSSDTTQQQRENNDEDSTTTYLSCAQRRVPDLRMCPRQLGSDERCNGRRCGASAVQAFLTVNESNDLHLREQHKLRVTGPDGDGDYRLHPIPGMGQPPHQLLIKSHPLIMSDPSGEKFVGVLEIKGTGHTQVSQHAYDVTMELDANGCPSRLTFDAQQPQEHITINEGEAPDHHGGHAVAD